jgi:hypothetical protein
MEYLSRYTKPLNHDLLQDVLAGNRQPVEPLPTRISIEPLRTAITGIKGELTQSELDQALVEPVHRALADLTPREAADMRLWHWLCAAQLPELVWRRWRRQGVPTGDELPDALTSQMERRFLGSSSLAGISRNTLARLWWTAERLREGDDYSLARKALSNQDMFQNIFERFFGIYPPAARACLSRFETCNEAEWRRASRWLQQVASTTLLEILLEEQIIAILDEALNVAAVAS